MRDKGDSSLNLKYKENNNIMKTISIEHWDSLIDLERVFYEKHTYESLLSYMSFNDIKDTQGYFKEYQEVMKRYYILCRKLESEVLLPEMGDIPFKWEVNFSDKYVTIREITR